MGRVDGGYPGLHVLILDGDLCKIDSKIQTRKVSFQLSVPTSRASELLASSPVSWGKDFRVCIIEVLIGARFDQICVCGSFTHLKRAVAKDRGEDGSGQHGDDGQDHCHAVCVGGGEELICLEG